MLREEEALVLGVKPFELHGLTYYDVTIAFRDGSIENARLGPEAVHRHPSGRHGHVRSQTMSSRHQAAGPSP
jgi:hypothetical protein